MPDSDSEKMTRGGIWNAAITATVGRPAATESLCSPNEETAKSERPSSTVSIAGSPGPPSLMVTSSPASR